LGWRGDLTLLPAFLDEHQQRLLALARCLILKPVVLFIDEPFRISDVSGWRHFGAVLERVRADGIAVVIVTHNLAFVKESGSRVVYCGVEGPRAFARWREFVSDPAPEIAEFLAEFGFQAGPTR
jgi:ABC-type sulfate/molybdate transport systems ATPase subunit